MSVVTCSNIRCTNHVKVNAYQLTLQADAGIFCSPACQAEQEPRYTAIRAAVAAKQGGKESK